MTYDEILKLVGAAGRYMTDPIGKCLRTKANRKRHRIDLDYLGSETYAAFKRREDLSRHFVPERAEPAVLIWVEVPGTGEKSAPHPILVDYHAKVIQETLPDGSQRYGFLADVEGCIKNIGGTVRSMLPTGQPISGTATESNPRSSSVSEDSMRDKDAITIPQPILDEAGKPLRAHCSWEKQGKRWNITIESRGGTLGTATERNPDYGSAFTLLLKRMVDARLTLVDALVVSQKLIEEGLSESDRRLSGDGLTYPLLLTPQTDIGSLDSSLRRAQAVVGSNRSKGSGNTTRRVAFLVEPHTDSERVGDIGEYLRSGGRATLNLGGRENPKGNPADFDPRNLIEAREQILASIAARRGQPKFRERLLRAYGRRCAITGCEVEEVLEAAHIVPYAGEQTNHVQNGILLRADLHTLFDRGLLGIDPRSWTVVVGSELSGSQYDTLRGRQMRLPERDSDRPNIVALKEHLQIAGL